MTPVQHCQPGLVGAALTDDRLWCGVIADGLHFHPAMLEVARRALQPDRLMLVTDAMPTVGTTDRSFELQEKKIRVADGKCVGPDGQLAGSALDMTAAVRNMVRWTGATVVDASAMASANPAAFLGDGRVRGTLTQGARADWVWLDAALECRDTWIGGVAATGAGSAR